MTELNERLELAIEAARTGAREAIKGFAERDRLDVISKGAQDRVTKVDRRVEEIIRETIERRSPGDAVLGEEYGASGSALTQGDMWVVDPIDGTDCFVFGLPMWSISIAWLADGVVQAGVVYDPIHDEMFAARMGGGATVNGKPIKVSSASSLSEGVFGIGYSTRIKPEQTLRPLELLMRKGGMFNRCGSGALSLAWVAAGRLIGYYEPHINSWDCLAGIHLVREAGGWHSDFLANDGLMRGNPLAASGPNLIEATQEIASAK